MSGRHPWPPPVEAEYEHAADAWLTSKTLYATWEFSIRCRQIAAEYTKRLDLEKAGTPLGMDEETP